MKDNKGSDGGGMMVIGLIGIFIILNFACVVIIYVGCALCDVEFQESQATIISAGISGVITAILGVMSILGFVEQKKVEERTVIHLDHLEGIEGFAYKAYFGLVIDRDDRCIEFECEKKKIRLPFSQICNANFITWEKTIIKPLNPMAEAFVTGLIAGDAMAVAAAVDAKGRTRAEKVKVEGALEIQYHPKGDFRTVKSIILGKEFMRTEITQFAETLCRCAGLPEPQYIQPEKKGPTYL